MESHYKKRGLVEQIHRAIKKYPKFPELRNFLAVLYSKKGRPDDAKEITRQTLELFPDYFFAKMNMAQFYLDQKQFGKVTDLLGKEFDLKKLYPDRDVFHVTEVLDINHIALKYFLQHNEQDKAQYTLELMQEIDPDSPVTKNATFQIMNHRMQDSMNIMKHDEEIRRKVKTIPYDKSIQTKKAPTLNHEEINLLYEFDIAGIPIDEIEDNILNLPRKTLLEDLNTLLKDAVLRYEYFSQNADEENSYFVIHTFFILGALKAEEKLDATFNFLRQDEEIIEFYLSDYIIDISNPLSFLLENKLNEAFGFMKKTNVYSFSLECVFKAVLYNLSEKPKLRNKVISSINDLLEHFYINSDNENLIDTQFISAALSDSLNFKPIELIELYRKLYEKDLVESFYAGDFPTIKNIIETEEPKKQKDRELPIEYYKKVQSPPASKIPDPFDENTPNPFFEKLLDDYLPDENDLLQNREIEPTYEPLNKDFKIGRNDPCPCGSGKKYKKCCMNK